MKQNPKDNLQLFHLLMVTTKHLDLDEDARLELAFNDNAKPDFNHVTFLTKFANYGISKLSEIIADTEDVELLESMMIFLNSTYESGAEIIEDELEIEDFE